MQIISYSVVSIAVNNIIENKSLSFRIPWSSNSHTLLAWYFQSVSDSNNFRKPHTVPLSYTSFIHHYALSFHL